MSAPVTAADVTIDRWTGDWGGPCATVTVNANLVDHTDYRDSVCRIRLRSSVGMEGPGRHCILVDRLDSTEAPVTGRGAMLGSFDTTDLDEAITLTIDLLNDMRRRTLLWWTVSDTVGELKDAVEAFEIALGASSPRTLTVDVDAALRRVLMAARTLQVDVATQDAFLASGAAAAADTAIEAAPDDLTTRIPPRSAGVHIFLTRPERDQP
jgi:hypothetical protein